MKKIKFERGYVTARIAAYPPVTEFIDAYVHERNGNPEPMNEYLAKVAKVKTVFPKKAK